MQVDRRTRGFQIGLEQHKVAIDPITKRHYRVMIVDPDMQRRESLADGLEQRFEIFVAPTNERAFALMELFRADFVLLHMGAGNDQTAASSPAIAFLHEMKRRCFRTPVAALVAASLAADPEAQKLLARALHQGGICGYFEVGIALDTLAERLVKLLRTLTVAQTELTRCCGIQGDDPADHTAGSPSQAHVPPPAKAPQGQLATATASKKTVTPPSSAGSRRPAAEVPTSRPNTVSFDRPGILLELSLNQRKQCHRQREVLQTTLAAAPHSVLGVDLSATRSSLSPCTPSSSLAAFAPASTRAKGSTAFSPAYARKKIPPLPSPQQVSQLIYSRPQELQTRIVQHLYERMHLSGAPGALPQDPLLHHCVVIDPRAQGRDLLVGKAYLLYQEQRLDEALVHCDRALRIPNATLEKLARLLRGALYDARGEHARAEREFLVCLALDPAMHEALFNLSVARLKLGKDALALEALTHALTLDPQNDKYLHNRALMYRRMGLFAQAQTEYSKRDVPSVPATAASGPRPAASSALSKCEMEDGLFAHLFGKPTADKLALACPPMERSADMLGAIVARLQTLLFFQDFPRETLARVARALDFDVVACGKRFMLGETHPQNFYVLLGGRLSVRRRVGTMDFASVVTTHHLDAGTVFGCAGFAMSGQASLFADECVEIGVLWPEDYDSTIRGVTSQTHQDVFAFLQQLRGFRLLSTSDLGHIVGISERKRFRQGDVLLEQNEHPQHLAVLWKGSCSVYQHFTRPPLCRRRQDHGTEQDNDKDDDDDLESDDDDESGAPAARRTLRRDATEGDEGEGEGEAGPRPFHHLIAKSDWPLGFQARAHGTRARKYLRGRRNGLVLSKAPIVLPQPDDSSTGGPGDLLAELTLSLPLPTRELPDKLAARDKKALVQTCAAPAAFGESTFLDQTHAPSKCCVVAESLVEVLLFDHLRLQEMNLAPEVLSELRDLAPKYLSEKQVARKEAYTVSIAWLEVGLGRQF
ncbi:hypothetical protein BBJ28_00004729 [Nothophytophthora sp. Chile5]|nr:hypothetical protein BBJ28_00004729 [Nothophytophthora sp. Chile5]